MPFMKHLLLLSFLCLSFGAIGQAPTSDSITVPIVNRKAGIYFSFEDFKNDKAYTFAGRYKIKRIQPNPEWYGLYDLDDNLVKDIWGFCDGTDVFIWANKYARFKNRYARIRIYGKYCIFTDLVHSSTAYSSGLVWWGGLGGTLGVHIYNKITPDDKYYDLFVLDSTNGSCTEATDATMRKLIGSNPELWEAYQKDTSKNKILSYLVKFNIAYAKALQD